MPAYGILGSGRQGTAAAWSLARHFGAAQVRLVDLDPAVAGLAAERVNALLGREVAFGSAADARDPESLADAFAGVAAVLSAAPYPLNPAADRAAIAARAHFTDLGGNTDVVRAELGLDLEARAARVSLVPDAGLAPGLSNALAALALKRLPAARDVRMWCGGLPRTPRGPLGYRQVFHIGGLTNEYSGKAIVLRDGKRLEVDALTELEPVEFPAPVGRAEAFLTSGGTSTGPWTWEGRLDRFEYKTVRYPGHHAMIWPLAALGFLGLEPVYIDGAPVVPRELTNRLLAAQIDYPDEPDLVVLRVEARTPEGRTLGFDLLDHQDPATGFTAMERSTAFPAAALAALQAEGGVEPGARSLEAAFDPERYVELVRRTGLVIAEREG